MRDKSSKQITEQATDAVMGIIRAKMEEGKFPEELDKHSPLISDMMIKIYLKGVSDTLDNAEAITNRK